MLQTTRSYTHTRIFKELAIQIPLNAYKLPSYLLDYNSLLADTQNQSYTDLIEIANANVANSIIELDYSEGYPTLLYDGSPIWEPLPKEPHEYHESLSLYLMMPYRAMQNQPDDIEILDPSLAHVRAYAYMRSLKHLANNQHELSNLYEHATLYHWATRAKAYDIFRLAADEKRKQQLQRDQEYHQYDRASKLLDQSFSLLNTMLANPEQYEVSAADVIKLYNIATKAQRTAIGLPENGPAKGQSEGYQDFSSIMRSITDKTYTPQTTEVEFDPSKLNAEDLEQLETSYFKLQDASTVTTNN